MINLCDKCDKEIKGQCCYYSVIIDGFNIILTNHPCKYLDTETKLCQIYKNRKEINPNCMSIEEMIIQGMVPKKCQYVINNPEYQKRKLIRMIKIPFNLSKYGKIYYNDMNSRAHEEIATYDVVRSFICPKCSSGKIDESWNEEDTDDIDFFYYNCDNCGHQWNTKKETIEFNNKICVKG